MNSKQLRNKAWNALKGRYWWSVLVALVAALFGVISFSTSVTTSSATQSTGAAVDNMPDYVKIILLIIVGAVLVIAIAMTIIGAAVKLGYCRYNMDLFTAVEKPSIGLLFSRTKIVWKALGMAILKCLILTVATFLFIIPGIILGLMYSQSEYILAENPELKATEAMKKSRVMMKGNKWKFFKLGFSFIGWHILAGIVPAGGLLLAPYTNAANAAFYLEHTGRLSEKTEESAKDLGDLASKAEEAPAEPEKAEEKE